MMRFWSRFLPAMLAAGLSAGCSALGALNAIVPSNTDELAVAQQPYGSDPRQVLDVYHPREKPMGPSAGAPVVVFFYGGRWETGSTAEYRFVAEALAGAGYEVVLPDYRHYPQVTYPAFVEDGARAVRWVEDHIASYGGDPRRVFLAGHSSGAYIAAMLALNPAFLNAAGVDRTRLRGFVGIAGPYDFLPFKEDDLKAIFGPPAQWPETMPIHWVDGHAPPMLLLQGTSDDIVFPANATHLAAEVKAKGGDAREVPYANIDHYKIIAALAWPFRGLAPVLADTVAFLRAHA